MEKRTLARALLARSSGQEPREGEICRVRVDFAFANDITAPPAIREFYEIGARRVFDPSRCAIVPDHFTPNKDIAAAQQVLQCREFAKAHGLLFWEVGRTGVEHAMLPEGGHLLPGEVVLGADSHSCTGGALGAFATGVGSTDLAAAWALGETWLKVPPTVRVDFEGKRPEHVTGKDFILALLGQIGVSGARYKALEFGGEALGDLPMDDRFTISNMAVETGAKCGLFEPDETMIDYVRKRAVREFDPVFPDKGASYEKRITLDVSEMRPLVALPHSPANVRPAEECSHLVVDQVFIGSCTNGRLRDLELAAGILQGKKVHERVRLLVIPASVAVWQEALERGYIKTFIEAGAFVCGPSCGPCLGGHLGILAEKERCVSTSNRNFVGRMGHPSSEVILAGPLVAAASAITGHVSDPKEVLS